MKRLSARFRPSMRKISIPGISIHLAVKIEAIAFMKNFIEICTLYEFCKINNIIVLIMDKDLYKLFV